MVTDQPVYLRTRQVLKLLNISKSQWQRLVKSGVAPAGKKLSPRVFVWRESDILGFIANAETVGGAAE